ncbi:MAG: hypothetical protein EOO90_06515 [Pedobacter sp.]|nr:MAG: hypothetical protein EOO90_06515 [Pedobacter sp.]
MSKTNSPSIIFKPVSELNPDDVLINLGKILEIEEKDLWYVIVIAMMDEKQIHKFPKNTELAIY